MAKIRVKFTRPPGTAAAVAHLAIAAGRVEMLHHWHTSYVPVHFTLEANRRYAYQPRVGDDQPPRLARADGRPGTRANPAYSWRKRRMKRHNRPLVWSGDSERAATNPANFDIRHVSGDRTRGVFVNLPDYWYRYHKGGVYWRRHVYGGMQSIVLKPQPNKADELTRITNAEAADLQQVGARRVVSFIQSYRPPTSGVA